MTSGLIGLPLRRPIATAMFFLALVLFAIASWILVEIVRRLICWLWHWLRPKKAQPA